MSRPRINPTRGIDRRDFLKTASAATLSALAAPYSRPLFAAEENPEAKVTEV